MDRIDGWPKLLEQVQSLLCYEFGNAEWAREALTHSSYSNEDRKLNSSLPGLSDNERLEFLGDAVIGLVVAQLLMERFPDATEGKLSRWRSYLVSRRHLAELAAEMGLGSHLLLGQGERRTGGAEKRSILAAAFEALVGAVYLDGGLEVTTLLLQRVLQNAVRHLDADPGAPVPSLDNKTFLQELTQSLYKSTPLYKLVSTSGPEHEKTFRVEIQVDGKSLGTGEGKSKKEAEQRAAALALEGIDKVRRQELIVAPGELDV